MSDRNCQKIKLLLIMEILRSDTDEDHPMGTSEICQRLEDQGVSCDRRTLARDISTLNSFDFEVMTTRKGHENAYYIPERSFSVPELKILIDAVQAASFITPSKTEVLVQKIGVLGGSHRAEILMRSRICFNTRKHTNEAIYYIVDAIESAIEEKRRISFYYFDLTADKRREYRKEKKKYVVEPVALVFSEDNYYLVCYSEKYDNLCTYRVDRMESVDVLDEEVSQAAILASQDISEHTTQVFHMYAGEPLNIVLQFDNTLIGSVYDKFGEDTEMIRHDENSCIASVTVQISPTFWGWMFQFGGKMKILAPDSLVEEYKQRAMEIADSTRS